MANQVKYLKSEKANLFVKSDSSKEVYTELLWGDRVEIVNNVKENNRYKVKARGYTNGYVDADDIGDVSLLEFYFIDVGQGDAVFIVTPDRKHILLDGGYNRDSQPHGKSAADFVDWKFKKDYGESSILLDAMICSHCDADHYGGLWDLVNPKEKKEIDVDNVKISNFYHAGVSWWKGAKDKYLGESKNGYLLNLISDSKSIEEGLKQDANPKLQGNWAKFLECILKFTSSIKRLSYNPSKGFDYIPGFESNKDVSIKVLGPIEHIYNGKPVVSDFKDTSKNTNGNSILLRVDYGRSKILLTGDLNKKSQQHILEVFKGNRQELAADVVKSCHHGSDDCSLEFLSCVNASATIISSGDDETHAHPRPNIVAASGLTGFRSIKDDELITPLVYSTEVSRSYKLGDPYKVEYKGYETGNSKIDVSLEEETKTDVFFTRTSSGALNPTKKSQKLSRLKVVDGIVYGLVNVRTDGNKILCATLNEGKSKWEIKTFESRF